MSVYTRASLGFHMGHLLTDLYVVPFPYLSFILTVLSCVNNSLYSIVLYGKCVNVPRRAYLTFYSETIWDLQNSCKESRGLLYALHPASPRVDI